MKKTFEATVVGLSHTDTSGFATGAHSVSLDILGQAPLGQVPRRVELPLFSVEEARELGALYRSNGAVKITIQVGEPKSEADSTVDKPNLAHGAVTAQQYALWIEIMRTVTLLQNAVSGRMPSVSACRSLCVDLGAAANAVFGGTEPPPIVNGKPSCCEPVRGSGIRIAALDGSSVHGWAIGAHIGVKYCLYCGTKLPSPDGAPS